MTEQFIEPHVSGVQVVFLGSIHKISLDLCFWEFLHFTLIYLLESNLISIVNILYRFDTGMVFLVVFSKAVNMISPDVGSYCGKVITQHFYHFS